ncbi:MAG: hypothetical protein CR982_02960 [Candidatus Cloacimonadota bacterium]|nr:MAG: hypothetical protein CR982_02960 [Candidatus Cloacimonadota bacterium]PIE82026.1 MAG: hypothetical protein CSA15_00150 [Candidatus Delongbacteria bacterium]
MIKKIWPILVFLLATIILFSGFIFSDDLLFSSDQIESGVFFRQMYADFVKENLEMPLWDRFITSGLPFVDAMHGDTFYPATILKFFIPLYKALGAKLVIHVFLAGVFMFIFLRNFGMKRISSFLGALSYMTAPMFVTLVHPGHDAKMYVAALFPLAFNFLHKYMYGKGVRNLIYLGFIVGLMILSSGVHVTYFGLWLIFFYFIFIVIRRYKKSKDLKGLFFNGSNFALSMIFGLVIGAVSLLPPYLYKEYSIRGTDAKTSFEHAISWGLHPEEAVSLIVPEFCGEGSSKQVLIDQMASQNGISKDRVIEYYDKNRLGEERSRRGDTYWGRNMFKLNSEYSGILPIIFTLLGLFIYRGRYKSHLIFFSVTALFFLLYSLVDHTPLFYLAYKLIPGVKLLRGQSMSMYLFTFSTVTAMTIMFNYIENFVGKEYNDIVKKRFKIFGGVIAVLFIIPLVPSLFNSLFGTGVMPDSSYIPQIRVGAIISIIITIIALVISDRFIKGKLTIMVFTIIMGVLIFGDTYRVNKKFIKTVDRADLGVKFSSDPLIDQLKDQLEKEPFRVLNANGYSRNELGIHGIETLGGFHDNELKWHRYYRGVNKDGVNTDKNIMSGLSSGNINNLLNISGVKYILFKGQDGKPQVIPNNSYMPRAWTVGKYEVVSDDNAPQRMLNSEFDFKNTILLPEKIDFTPRSDNKEVGKVKDYRWEGNSCIIDVDMKENGILFVSDNYMPHWKVTDQNGKDHTIYRANLTYRAIPLEKGEYHLSFNYESTPYIVGKYLTVLGILITLLTYILEIKKQREAK